MINWVIIMNSETKVFLQKLGKQIKVRRKELKVNQEVMANEIGVDRKHLSAIENGRQNLTIETLFRVCDGLKIKVQDLLDKIEE